MHVAVLDFFMRTVNCEEFNGKRVLEVGSKFVNGSVRPLIERFCQPKEYIGVDIEPGRYVDVILPAEKLIEYFGIESFDVVISTEVMEHVFDWRLIINNIKSVLKRGGFIYLTTRSRGFAYHAYPHDYWRYETGDIIAIFRDFKIIELEYDWEAPGVFLKAKKPINWIPTDLNNIALYSIILGKRTKELVTLSDAPLARKIGIILLCSTKLRWSLPGVIIRRHCT
jgi:SAM-dependent methyltransferase